jgi:L-amino acid N-acyltransferase YncA
MTPMKKIDRDHRGSAAGIDRRDDTRELESRHSMPTDPPSEQTTSPGGDPAVRLAVPSDATAINDILNYYVVHTTATFITVPGTASERLVWLKERDAIHPVIVVEHDGSIAGWASLSAFRPRQAYRQTAEVGVYVRHDLQRRGIGRTLVSELIVRARALGHHVLVGGCCHESTASLALMESLGFTQVARFREVGRKFDRWLDVIFLQLIL